MRILALTGFLCVSTDRLLLVLDDLDLMDADMNIFLHFLLFTN